jgi:2-keto-4-pentenoate hydratase/2-oxohepta-3-ene-1,7-dioic acid hydratase in catechol pathway
MTMKEEREFFCFCKSFDSYGVLGPCMVTADEISNPSELAINSSSTASSRRTQFSDLTGSPAQLVAFASSAMTLYPGTSSCPVPPMSGRVHPGDVMTLEIPRIGRMDVCRVRIAARTRHLENGLKEYSCYEHAGFERNGLWGTQGDRCRHAPGRTT